MEEWPGRGGQYAGDRAASLLVFHERSSWGCLHPTASCQWSWLPPGTIIHDAVKLSAVD